MALPLKGVRDRVLRHKSAAGPRTLARTRKVADTTHNIKTWWRRTHVVVTIDRFVPRAVQPIVDQSDSYQTVLEIRRRFGLRTSSWP
jgi:hypothetical protein